MRFCEELKERTEATAPNNHNLRTAVKRACDDSFLYSYEGRGPTAKVRRTAPEPGFVQKIVALVRNFQLVAEEQRMAVTLLVPSYVNSEALEAAIAACDQLPWDLHTIAPSGRGITLSWDMAK